MIHLEFLEMYCKKCKIALTEFEVVEKDSFCMDCFHEERQERMQPDKNPTRLKNKRLFVRRV